MRIQAENRAYRIGEVMAESFCAYFADEKNRRLLAALLPQLELDESEHSGIGRMHFDVGVRFHF